VILAIDDKGAERVPLQDIYSVIEKFRPLSKHDLEPHERYPQENFKHTTRSTLAKLKKYDLAEHIPPAQYSLTARSIKNISVFRDDRYGRGVGKEIGVAELLERLGLAKDSKG
jgi:hypothetical protein